MFEERRLTGKIVNKKSRDVIRRLCNKDRDQGSKGIGLIGIDHVVTYSTSDK